ncbi:hypothetical protein Tco_1410359 [Tanacetum coccineum]
MVNQEQNTPQQEQPFVAAKQEGFNLEDIILNPNNEEYLIEFKYLAKALENSKVYFSTPIGDIYGEVGVNTFRNAIGAHYLPHFSEYVAPPSIDIVRPWFEKIRYPEAIPAKAPLRGRGYTLGTYYVHRCKAHHQRGSDCPERRNQNHENQTGGTGARGVVHALGGGETDQDPNNIEDEIEA